MAQLALCALLIGRAGDDLFYRRGPLLAA